MNPDRISQTRSEWPDFGSKSPVCLLCYVCMCVTYRHCAWNKLWLIDWLICIFKPSEPHSPHPDIAYLQTASVRNMFPSTLCGCHWYLSPLRSIPRCKNNTRSSPESPKMTTDLFVLLNRYGNNILSL